MVNLCVHFGNFLRGQKTLFGWVGGGGRKNETLPKRVISFIFDT